MGQYRWTLDDGVTSPLVLTNDPEGWQDLEMSLKRDMKLHGVFQESSVDMKFFCGSGKEYIDNIYENYGINHTIEILIEYKCSETDDFEDFFDGKIQLKGYKSDRDYTTVNVIQNDIWSLVRSRWDTKVSLSTTTTIGGNTIDSLTNAPYNLTLHNRKVQFLGDFEIDTPINGGSLGLASTAAVTANFLAFVEIPANVIVDDLGTGQIPTINGNASAGAGTLYVNKLDSPLIISNTDHTFRALFDGTYDLTVDIDFDVAWTITAGSNPNLDYLIDFRVYAGTVPNAIMPGQFRLLDSTNIDTVTGLTTSGSDNYTHSDTFSFTLYEGEYIFFVLFIQAAYTDDTSGTATIGFEYNTADITYDITDDSLASTTCSAYAIYEAFSKVVNSITDLSSPSGDNFKSALLGRKNSEPTSYASNGCGSFLAINHGRLIRGFPLASNPTILSLKDLYEEGLSPILNLGMGIENGKVVVEEVEYFYDDTVVLTIDNVVNIEKAVKPELFYSNVEVGFQKWESEDVSGIREFNNRHDYAIPDISVLDGKYSSVSNFIAGGYPIEFTRRRQYGDESTEDYMYDNEYFIFALNRSVDGSGNPNNLGTCEKNENFTTTTNVFEPGSVYNLRLTPKKILLRHINMIAAGLTKLAGSLLKFTKSASDASIETDATSVGCIEDYASALLNEDGNIAWDDTNVQAYSNGIPMFIPEEVKFEAPITYSEWKTLRANPLGTIAYSRTDSGHEYGFIISANRKNIDGMTQFTLIRKYN